MVNIGDIVVQTQEETFRLGLLTVRQMATMQNALGARMASDCIEDGKALGMGHDSLLEAAKKARAEAQLSSTLLRSCFEITGALAIIAESAGGMERAETIVATMTPDEVTGLALQLLGFEWDSTAGKWRSRSRSGSGAGIA